MSQRAPRIHTDPEAIQRLKALQLQLDAELLAELHMRDGRVIVGTIVERPNIQQFIDEEGNEGTNGLIRLDAGQEPVQLIWLDEVEHVVRIGSF